MCSTSGLPQEARHGKSLQKDYNWKTELIYVNLSVLALLIHNGFVSNLGLVLPVSLA